MRSHISMFVLMVALCASGARATEPIAVPLSTSAALPIYDENTFDWSGFYAGVTGGAREGSGGGEPALGAQVGVQAQFDFYLVGAEVAVRGLPGSTGQDAIAYGDILGRAGVVSADSLLVYTAAGYGLDLATQSDQQVLLGGGVEIPLSDTVTFGARYLRGVPVGGGEATNSITFGANWHF